MDNIILDMHMWEVVRDYIFYLKPKSILDVGCGEAMLWRGYGYRGRHNLKDPDVEEWKLPWECEIILCDYDVYNHPLPTIQCDAHNLPFPDKRFELIVSSEVIEHAVDPKKFSNEIRRVGQHYILTTPAESHASLEDENVSEQLWLNNPWRINCMKYFSDKEFSHHRHLHLFREENLREMFPEAKIFYCFNRIENIRFYTIVF